jgi:conjugative transposon TraJ protein
MRQYFFKTATLAVIALLLPCFLYAQGIADEMKGLHGVLEQLFNEMIPLCSKMIDVGRALAGFGAMWYIGYRVWKQIANAEPIDFFPLFRPFAIGLAITLYLPLVNMMNLVLRPTVSITAAIVEDSDAAIEELLKKKEEAIKGTKEWQMYVGETGDGDRDAWYRYTHPGQEPTDEGFMDGLGNSVEFAMSKMYYNFKNSVKQWMSEVLQVVFQAASLAIDALCTFQRVVLVMLGPLVLGLAVFDGFQQSLVQWLGRYINIFMWLPIANIFGAIIGKIQENMIKIDLAQIAQDGQTSFSSADTAYLVFMIIGIVGYFTVPSVANYIVHAHGANAMLQRVTTIVSSTASRMSAGAGNIVDAYSHIKDGMSGNYMPGSGGFMGDLGKTIGKTGAFMADKLSGDTKDDKNAKKA